jgi:hypothetical protein
LKESIDRKSSEKNTETSESINQREKALGRTPEKIAM